MSKTVNRNKLARSLSLALLTALGASVVLPAMAQEYGVDEQSMREKRDAARGKTTKKDKAAETVPAMYPGATRTEPEAKASGKDFKALQALQETYQAQDYATALTKAEALAASALGAYEKAFAYQIAAAAAAELDQEAKSADYFQKAIASNGLDNNSHYTSMYNLVATQFGLDQYDQALVTLDRFLAETKSDKPEYQALRAGILANLGRNEEAAAIYAEQMAKNPDDPKILMNAVAAYQQADQFDKANALLADAQKKGQLTEPNQYRALYVGYINADKDTEALAVIDDGIAKGVIVPGPDLAKDYMVLAQKAYFTGSDNDALALYKRAAPIAADGEASLNLAKILADQGKTAEAKAAAQQALDKGVKAPAEAKAILGQGGG